MAHERKIGTTTTAHSGVVQLAYTVVSPACEFTRETFHASEFDGGGAVEGPVFGGWKQDSKVPLVYNHATRGDLASTAGREGLTYWGTDMTGNTTSTLATAIRTAIAAYVTP